MKNFLTILAVSLVFLGGVFFEKDALAHSFSASVSPGDIFVGDQFSVTISLDE